MHIGNIYIDDFPYSLLANYELREAARRKDEVDSLRAQIRQVPTTDSTLRRLSNLSPEDYADVMQRHPGHRLDKRARSLWATLDIFRLAWSDLQGSFEEFRRFGEDFSIPHNARPERRGEILLLVRRDLLVLSTSSAGLVAMARRVNEVLHPPDFKQQKKIFSTQASMLSLAS
jgi:hypothetical protein